MKKRLVLSTGLFAALLAGCSGNHTAVTPAGEAVALTAASSPYNNTLSIEGQFLDYVDLDWFPMYSILGGDNLWKAGISYRHYNTVLGGTGWTEVDAFKAKSAGYGADLIYINDDGDSLLEISGDYTATLADSLLMDIGAGWGQFSNGGTDNFVLLSTGLTYYLMDTLSVRAEWDYTHYENGGSASWFFYRALANLLLEGQATFLISAGYEHENINNGGGNMDNGLLSATWYATEMFKLGLNFKMGRGMLGEVYNYELMAGIRAGNGVISLGYEILDPAGYDSDSKATLGYKMQF